MPVSAPGYVDLPAPDFAPARRIHSARISLPGPAGGVSAKRFDTVPHYQSWLSPRGIVLRLWFALAVGSGIFLPVFLAMSIGSIPASSDFITFYSAGYLAADGRAGDAYQPAALEAAATAITHQPVDGLRWLYPPGMGLAFSLEPLATHRDIATRSLVWAAGSLLVTPFIYDYDLAIFVVPLAALAWQDWRDRVAWLDAVVMSALWWGSFAIRYLAQAASFQPGPLLAAGLLLYAFYRPVPRDDEALKFAGRSLERG
jgi:hypothetical protein